VNAGNYILTITDSNNCSSQFGGSNGVNISQTFSVVASFTANPTTGETPLSVNFTNTTTGATNYSWDFGTGDFSIAVNPTYVYVPLGNFTVCLIADNGAACADTACSTIDIYLNSVFVIPNVFTPNGDNVNDVFAVQAVGLSTMDAEVFNRWGQKEFEWHTTNGGWDGRTASGIIAPDGTYFFTIKAKGIDGKEYFEKGSFTLIR
jgi:gliding motility-associated-like protein